MRNTFNLVNSKLALLTVLSSVLLWCAAVAEAHEVQPTIGDLTVTDGTLTLDLRLNVEAFLAEIDLDTVDDTNSAENADDYDALRALPADAIADRSPDLLSRWNAVPLVTADGQAVELRAISLDIPSDVDIESPRVSTWRLVGDVATDVGQVTVNWPDGAGANP